ncbi:ABC transporter substrate-binding protein [Thermus thermophilus]|nr:ABC transporter substrate-binding protein [Thermus thermophilus]
MRALALLPWLLAAALAQVQVAATTPILADLVRQVGGKRVAVVAVVPRGPTPTPLSPPPPWPRP